jgi:hypothetical protein
MKCGSCAQSGQIIESCFYCGGTGEIQPTFCHCGKPTNNATRTLCSEHTDELRNYRRKQAEDRLATMRAQWKYFIPDGDLGISYEDEGPWRSYDISDACGNTVREFLEAINISEIDQDGGELRSYGFEDAPSEVRKVILEAVGLTEGDL